MLWVSVRCVVFAVPHKGIMLIGSAAFHRGGWIGREVVGTTVAGQEGSLLGGRVAMHAWHNCIMAYVQQESAWWAVVVCSFGSGVPARRQDRGKASAWCAEGAASPMHTGPLGGQAAQPAHRPVMFLWCSLRGLMAAAACPAASSNFW
jgi:hypothetical protein